MLLLLNWTWDGGGIGPVVPAASGWLILARRRHRR